MRITEGQKQGLVTEANRAFYEELVAFFTEEEPALFKTLEHDEGLAFAKACHDRCVHYGLQAGTSIYAWADFSILVGSHFYRDPFFLPMMTRIKRGSVFTEDERMEEARTWLADYLPAVRGPDNAHAANALRGLQQLHAAYPDPAGFSVPQEWALPDYVAGLCREIYPQLVEYHGEDAVRDRVRMIVHQCERYYGLKGEWHLKFMALMGMSFGVGFDYDELYPWIQRPFDRVEQTGPEAAVERLARRTKVWVAHVLDLGKASA